MSTDFAQPSVDQALRRSLDRPFSPKVEKLGRMANQIARFFSCQPGGRAAAETAEHLRLYWPVSMRDALLAYADRDGAGLESVARAAIKALAGRSDRVSFGGGCVTARALHQHASPAP